MVEAFVGEREGVATREEDITDGGCAGDIVESDLDLFLCGGGGGV